MRISSLRVSFLTTLALLKRGHAKAIDVEVDPSPGCQNSIPHDTLAEISTKLQDYPIKVSLPPTYDSKKPSPLILVYNDRDVTLENMVEVTGLSDGEVNRDAVVVYLAPKPDVSIPPHQTSQSKNCTDMMYIVRLAFGRKFPPPNHPLPPSKHRYHLDHHPPHPPHRLLLHRYSPNTCSWYRDGRRYALPPRLQYHPLPPNLLLRSNKRIILR